MSVSVAFLLTAAVTSAPLPPTSKWQVNFDEGQCLAQRSYGTPDHPLTLALKAPASGDVIQLAIAGDKGGTSEAEQVGGTVGWNSARAHKVSVLQFKAVDARRRMYLVNLPKAEVAEAAASSATQLHVDLGPRAQYSFALANLPNVMKVMDQCVQDLRTYWNYVEGEAATSPKLRFRASASLPSLFSPADYPRVAVQNYQTGQVEVVLLIRPDGRVADCTLTATSGVASLDSQTCAIIRERARYKPALGLDGKPARDVDHARIRWKMP